MSKLALFSRPRRALAARPLVAVPRPDGKQILAAPLWGARLLVLTALILGLPGQITVAQASQAVLAWGENSNGALGDGTTTIRTVPTDITNQGVLNGKTVIQIVGGLYHSLALCSDGTLAVWGSGSSGQLGDGTITRRTVPVDITNSGVLSGKRVTQIACGANHSVALCSDGTIAAWGYNSQGQLGNGANTDSRIPVAVVRSGALSGKTVTQLACGDAHTLALCSDGTIATWGNNSYGQLGDGANTDRNVPNSIANSGALNGKIVTQISSGYYHNVALCNDGKFVAWGNNYFGQLGDGTNTNQIVPIEVTGNGALSGKTVTQISCGHYHTLALCSDGTVAAYGDNRQGQLGDGTNTAYNVPKSISNSGALNGKTVIQLSSGIFHNSALCNDGAVVTWGTNFYGQLGDGTRTDHIVPIEITGNGAMSGKKVTRISSGQIFQLALATTSSAPVVTTGSATAITSSGATLSATVNPGEAVTTAKIEYGLDTGYGQEASLTLTPSDGAIDQSVNAVISGLSGHTTYHYRVSASNSNGTSVGADATFTTLNSVPQFTDTGLGAATTLEDNGLLLTLGASDADGDTLSFQLTSLPAHGTLYDGSSASAPAITAASVALPYTLSGTGAEQNKLLLVPAADFNGSDSFDYGVADGYGGSASGTASLTVTPVNDAPGFLKGSNQSALESAGAKSVAGWATGLSAGPADESGQTLSFVVSNNNNALFTTQPAVAADGTLSFTPRAGVVGSALVSVQIQDDGGVQNGGADTSAAQSFTITTTDGTKPTVVQTAPFNNQNLLIPAFKSGVLKGSASDNIGVASVEVKITRLRGGITQTWNGSDFATASVRVPATTTGSGRNVSWVLNAPFPSASQLDAGQYIILVYATDAAGNTSSVTTRITLVTPDTELPVAQIFTPAVNQKILFANFGAGALTGNATDNVGVTSVRLKLSRKRGGVNYYWNGTAFTTAAIPLQATVATVGASSTKWNLDSQMPPAAALDSGLYQVEVYAQDASNNKSLSAVRPFTLGNDFTAPSVAIVAPTASQKLSISAFGSGTINGTAGDNLGVASVKVKLMRKRGTVTTYWNGSAFVTATSTVDATLSTAGGPVVTWSLTNAPTPATGLDAGGYTIYASAYDVAGNTRSSASRGFTLTAVMGAPAVSNATPSGNSEGRS